MFKSQHGIPLCLVMVGLALTPGGYAGDAQIKSWANNVNLNWSTSSVWENGYVPNDPSDTVNLYVKGNAYRLALRFDTSISVDAVTNGPLLGCYGFVANKGRLSIRKADGFNKTLWPFGTIWNGASNYLPSSYVMAGVNFLGTAAEPTRFRLFSLGAFPHFGAPAAGNSGRIDHLVDSGSFLKDGPGDLCLGAPSELTTALLLQEGSVSFDTQEETRTDEPASDPFIHVDASRAETRLDHYDADSGRTYVTNWYDVRNNGKVAKAETWKSSSYDFTCSAPYLADHTVNGRQLVDFGVPRSASEGQSATRPAASMLWSHRTEQVREIFLAIELAGGDCQPIGESSDQVLGMSSNYGHVFYYSSSASSPALGDVRVNGASATALNGHPYDAANLRIVSCALPAGTNAKAQWFGRYGSSYNPRVGGFRLGEALVYTRDLTEAERRQTIAYLKRRWLPESSHRAERAEWDLGEIVGSTNENAIVVAEGNMARVRRLRGTAANGFVKEGAGTLAVDRIGPATTPVTVRAGTLRLTDAAGAAPELTASTLPDDPIFHFDATDTTSVKLAEGSDSEVESWCDVRGEGYPVATNKVSARPVVGHSISPTGLRTVEFVADAAGPSAAAAARMRFGDRSTYEGFIVWKSTVKSDSPAPDKNPPHFCPISQFRTKNQLVPVNENMPGGGYAVWSVDGQVIHQYDDSFTQGKAGGGWVLIHFTSSRPFSVNGMACLGESYGGGCAIGELIGYGRMLTDRERRGTEAYLMKRWLGKTHPDNVPWAGALTFADGVSAVLDTDCDIAPASVATTSSTLVKKGVGKATVGSLPASVTALSVADGTLAVPPAALANVSSLSVGIDEDGAKGTLDVDGTYAVPAAFDLSVGISSAAYAQSLRGRSIKLIGATAVTDRANLAGWTLTTTGFGDLRAFLVARGDGIYLRLGVRGTILSIH